MALSKTFQIYPASFISKHYAKEREALRHRGGLRQQRRTLMAKLSLRSALLPALLTLLTASYAARAATPLPTANTPTLEMVFVLDTTGSMGGLLDGAKQKIWSIVNSVQQSAHPPRVRVGLVAYRDHGDDYVTRVTPLTSDLDKIYTTLMTYQAVGGGDTPEDVRQALSDGVRKGGWSARSPHTAQVLFLVGDAPPHNDYAQEPDTLTTAALAAKRGIVINTIECGSAEDTRIAWQKIAGHAEGAFFAIEENGGVQVTPTPYDKPLAKLGSALGQTYTAYGGGGFAGGAGAYQARSAKRQAYAESTVAAAAPAPADRALNKALNSEAYAGDLMQSLENGSVKLKDVKPADLPVAMQKMTPEAREKEIARRLAERKTMRTQILALSQKRDMFLAAAAKKKSGGKPPAFDAAVTAALRKQLAPKGIRL